MTEERNAKDIGDVLGDLLRERGTDKLYACIWDLVANGLDPTRFGQDQAKPNRQAVTHYLAAWSRHAGLSREESSAWLIDYCCEKLASLSNRTPAAIRHSTKGVLKYTYESMVPFFCECADNPFRAECRRDCPVHDSMQTRLLDIKEGRLPAKVYYRPPLPEGWGVPVRPVKAVYREQFEEGMQLALEEESKGTRLPQILALLQERGFKSRTGRVWTKGTLFREMRKATDHAGRRERFEAAMRFALEEYARGLKPAEIAENLRAQGFKTRTGRRWTEPILRGELLRAQREGSVS